MKKTKLYIMAFLGVFALASCSQDDPDEPLPEERTDISNLKTSETQDVVTDQHAYSRQGVPHD